MAGYALNGYRLWDIHKKKIITATMLSLKKNFPLDETPMVFENPNIIVRCHEQEKETEYEWCVNY